MSYIFRIKRPILRDWLPSISPTTLVERIYLEICIQNWLLAPATATISGKISFESSLFSCTVFHNFLFQPRYRKRRSIAIIESAKSVPKGFGNGGGKKNFYKLYSNLKVFTFILQKSREDSGQSSVGTRIGD